MPLQSLTDLTFFRIVGKLLILQNGCWKWTASKRGGYGRCRYLGRSLAAHRVIYQWFRGTVPDGLVLDHLCRNRACCNPDHLEPVTRKENTRRGDIQAMIAPGVTAHLRKIHCPQGHPYDEVNTYVDPRGSRHCRECSRLSMQRRRTNVDYRTTN